MSATNGESAAGGPNVTGLLAQWGRGEPKALGELVSAVYDHLHRLARRAMRSERRDHTLQATALVHEAFLRLAETSPPAWRDRQHFYAVTARLMRRILVDHARHLAAERHGGRWHKTTLDDVDGAREVSQIDLLALDEALTQLARVDGRKARVIELRFFAGLSVAETARMLAVSEPTVVLDTRLARAWLYTKIRGAGGAS
jgi:RNA polymerase sigma factor (TIGR02999 family)